MDPNMNQPQMNMDRVYYDHKKLEELEQNVADFRRQNGDSHERIFNTLNKFEKDDILRNEHIKSINDKVQDNVNLINQCKAKCDADIAALMARIRDIESKPTKQFEKIKDQLLMLVIGAVVAIVFMKIGLTT